MAETIHPSLRRHVLESEVPEPFPPAGAGAFSMRRAPFVARHVLRLAPGEAAQRSNVRGFDVGQAINTARGHETLASDAPRASLRLGPDEWLLIGEMAAASEAETGGAKLVDVSHRNVALEVVGGGVRDVLGTGIALDLDAPAFPVGAATRTVFAKAEVVILRCPDVGGQAHFRLECWRSFARYLAAHLRQSAVLLGHGPHDAG